MGGGLGHVTRTVALARALLETRPQQRIVFLVPERLRQLPLLEGFEVHCPPAEAQDESLPLARWLDAQWRALDPQLLVVDVFPRGILAEFLECRVFPSRAVLLTRLCRSGYYENPEIQESLKRYAQIYWTEGFRAPAVLREAREVGPITLFRRKQMLTARAAREELGFPKGVLGALVLRAGREEDQLQLLAGLRDLPVKTVQLAWGNHAQPQRFPLFPCYPGADIVVTAGGYHSVYELMQLPLPAIFWPQRRLYDDQHLRLSKMEIARQPKRWVVQSIPELHKAFDEFQKLRGQVPYRKRQRDPEYSGAKRTASDLLRFL